MFGQLFINHLHILIQHEITIFGFVKTRLRKIYLGICLYLLYKIYFLKGTTVMTCYLWESNRPFFQFTCFELCSIPPPGGQNSPEWMLAVAVSCQSSGNAQACEEHLTEALSAVYEKPWERRRSDSRRHSTRGRLQYKSIWVMSIWAHSQIRSHRLTITLQESEQCVRRQSRVSELFPPFQALNFFGFTRPHTQDAILC